MGNAFSVRFRFKVSLKIQLSVPSISPKEYFVDFKCHNFFSFHYYFLQSHAKQLVINN